MRRARQITFVASVLAGALASACGGRSGDVMVRDAVELARQDRKDEARARFAKALASSPSTPGARTGLAALEPDADKALAHLDKELAAHPTLPAARFDRARLHVLSGDAERARAALADLEGLDGLDGLEGVPGDEHVARLRELARFLADGGPVPAGLESVTASRAALQAVWAAWSVANGADLTVDEALLPHAPRLAAALHARDGRWADALAALPTTPDTLVERAICLAWLDRTDEARALVAEALRLDPESARARAVASSLD
ncbi:MAG: hypothetical protein IT385_04410 [Deltaproteobacteria bacterium]|nr:hypothetical protein [Deltaproteobacteria bacterium]